MEAEQTGYIFMASQNTM